MNFVYSVNRVVCGHHCVVDTQTSGTSDRSKDVF